MSGIFEYQGFTFLSHSGWNDTQARIHEKITDLAATNANAVALVARANQLTATTSEFTRTATTTDLAKMGQVIDEAHALNLSVTLTPTLDLPDSGSRGRIKPDDFNAWFKNYSDYILNYARLAQDKGVEMLSIGTEMTGVVNAGTTAAWKGLIAEIRKVYDGKITYQSEAYHAKDVGFWADLDVISVNGYVPVAASANPTLAEAIAGWNKTPTNAWEAAQLENKSPLDFYRDLALTYGKPFQFGELGYRNQDGIGADPNARLSSTPDADEQALLFEAFFQVFSGEASWFQGVNLFDWTTTFDRGVVYNLQYSSALSLIEDWFGGVRAPADRVLQGAKANDVLTAGAGDDLLIGGAGDDRLMGGAGDDTLIGDGPTFVKDNTLTIALTGVPAGGIDPLMRLTVGGKVIAQQGVPRGADGGPATLTFDLPPGVDASRIEIRMLNDGKVGNEDRDIYVHQVVLNGVALETDLSTNLKKPGTFEIKWNSALSFDLTSRQDIVRGGSALGSDVLDGGEGQDLVSYEHAMAGVTVDLSIKTAQQTGGGGLDLLRSIENLRGSAFADLLRGDNKGNVLEGGGGADVLWGGGGADVFVVKSAQDSTPYAGDRILDFSQAQGDRIDLSGLDANSGLAGVQDFTFAATRPAHPVAGVVWVEYVGADAMLYGHTDSDGLADFAIKLEGVRNFSSDGLLL